MMLEMPLPASNDGLAEITKMSTRIFNIVSKTSLTITLCAIPDVLLITKCPGSEAEVLYQLTSNTEAEYKMIVSKADS